MNVNSVWNVKDNNRNCFVLDVYIFVFSLSFQLLLIAGSRWCHVLCSIYISLTLSICQPQTKPTTCRRERKAERTSKTTTKTHSNIQRTTESIVLTTISRLVARWIKVDVNQFKFKRWMVFRFFLFLFCGFFCYALLSDDFMCFGQRQHKKTLHWKWHYTTLKMRQVRNEQKL